jgi:peptide/nickel transport system permease protein
VRRFLFAIVHAVALVLLAGFVTTLLVKCAPGFGVDERELIDTHATSDSVAAMRAKQLNEPVVTAYFHLMRNMLRGDWGESITLKQPVSSLLRERAPVTLRILALGLAGALAASMLAAALIELTRSRAFLFVSELTTGVLVCVPAAVIALILFLRAGAPAMGLALVLFPRLYRLFRAALASASAQPHVLAARARGVSSWRVLVFHVVSHVAPELAATVAISVPVALSAVVAIEVIFDAPGVGQLAWQAALARDHVVMVSVTIIIAALTVLARMITEVFLPQEHAA